jgi:hypothetical protein
VAEAFGVPEQNMVWDGEKLRVRYSKNLWKDYKPDSDIAVWSEGGRQKLEAPMRVKNGAMMINLANLFYTFIPTDPAQTPPLIEASEKGKGNNGVLNGKPIIRCSVAQYDHYKGYYVKYWDYKSQTVIEVCGEDAFLRQREFEKQFDAY